MREGTLKQLNVKVGDKVRPIRNSFHGSINGVLLILTHVDHTYCYCSARRADREEPSWQVSYDSTIFRLEEEAMEIKVGDEVEVQLTKGGEWWNDGHTVSAVVGDYYILTIGKIAPIVAHVSTVRKPKPAPVVKEVSFYGRVNSWQTDGFNPFPLGCFKTESDTHKITFNLVDGEPDCNSIKMSRL